MLDDLVLQWKRARRAAERLSFEQLTFDDAHAADDAAREEDEEPFDPQALRAALAALPCAADLTTGEAGRLRDLAGRLLAEKEMSTAGDLELTADMQVNIAVQACLPILNLGLEWYRGWSSIVVYPGEFHDLQTPSYFKDMYDRFLAWFAAYVPKGAASGNDGS